MKIVAISDTHGYHRRLQLPEGDMLVHCGDITFKGEWKLYADFLNWLKDQQEKFKHIIVIAGNHDFNHTMFAQMTKEAGITYLENSGVEIEGLKFWGTPNVSKLPRWAFDDSKDPTCWERIPDDVDILISHSPPVDFLDEAYHYGSSKLRARVNQLMEKKLKYHIFGHCHADGGKTLILKNSQGREVVFANAAICDVMYFPLNPILTIEVKNEQPKD